MDVKRERLRLDQLIFLLGVFAKQFYILPSGSLQVGDFLMLLGGLLLIIDKNKGRIVVRKQEYFFLIYIAFVAVINLIHYSIDKTQNYINSIIFYGFNAIIIFVFTFYINIDENDKPFLESLLKVEKLSLITQAVLLITNTGRWYVRTRYMGSFNDPNQYAVFILITLFFTYLIGTLLNKRRAMWVIIGSVLLMFSSSTGNFAGLFIFLFSMMLINLFETKDKRFIIWMILLVVSAALFIMIYEGLIPLPRVITESGMYSRVFSKIDKVMGDNNDGSLLSDRGWSRIRLYPEYFLYGAGEGYHQRFNTTQEIHSSIIGPLFYYGFVPCFFLFMWIRGKINKIRTDILCVYFGLFAESLFLANTRQPMFWMLIVIAGSRLAKKDSSYSGLEQQVLASESR